MTPKDDGASTGGKGKDQEPHEGSGTPDGWTGPDEGAEWRGGGMHLHRQQEERSNERGWGVANAGGQRQHGDGGQRGGDLDNQQLGGRDEKGDERRPDQR